MATSPNSIHEGLHAEHVPVAVIGPAAADDPAVVHNLWQMNGPMIRLLKNESLGGNAGRVELLGRYYSCGAAHGYADARSGRIVAFGNIQDVSPEIKAANAEFTLKVAFGGLRFFKIVQLFVKDDSGGVQLSPDARHTLEASVLRWNQQGVTPC